MGPLDYTLQVLDPIQAALEQRGLRFAEEQQVRAADQQDVALNQGQQRIDMAQHQFQAQQAELARQRAEQEAAKAQAEAGQQAFVKLMFDPNITADDVMGAVQANPSMAQPIMEYWQGRNAQQAESDLAFGKQIAFALGNAPDQAAALMESRAEAAQNVGDQETADTLRAQAELIRSGDDGVKAATAQVLMTLAPKMEPKELQAFMETAGLSVPKADEKPLSDAGKLEADFRAGRITKEAYQTELQRRVPKQNVVSVGADGSVTITEGAASGPGEATVGEVYNPGEVQSTLDLIKEIKEDPALARVTGPIQGGGGNDVEEFGMARRVAYGSEGLALIEKMNQLQSRSWLAARAMLKGGGPITDYESRKAEAAVARLSRTKDEKEYLAALTDLESAISEGMKKLEAARGAAQGSGDQAIIDQAAKLRMEGKPLPPEMIEQLKAIIAKRKGASQ